MLELPELDGVFSTADVKDVAADVIGQLPLQGIEGLPLYSGDIWSVVTMVSVNQSSVWDVTPQTDDTVVNWLHTLHRERLEIAANILFRHLALTILDRSRSRIVSIDFVDNPYHGDPAEEDGELCTTNPKNGTTTCRRYCTAYVVSNGGPVTLAVTYVRSDERGADAVERILDRVGTYLFEIDLLFADRGFYNERVIRRARDLATAMTPIQKKGKRMKDNLATHCSYMTTYRMYKGSEWGLRFPLAVPVSYQNGDRRKHGEVVRGCVACDLGNRMPTQVERRSRKRSAIETSYRLFRQARANDNTGSTRPACVHDCELPAGESLIRTAMGGRDLPEQFTFTTFCDWIRHELEAELARRREIEMNDVGIPDAYASVAG